jgi:hypothetical protein
MPKVRIKVPGKQSSWMRVAVLGVNLVEAYTSEKAASQEVLDASAVWMRVMMCYYTEWRQHISQMVFMDVCRWNLC